MRDILSHRVSFVMSFENQMKKLREEIVACASDEEVMQLACELRRLVQQRLEEVRGQLVVVPPKAVRNKSGWAKQIFMMMITSLPQLHEQRKIEKLLLKLAKLKPISAKAALIAKT